MKTGTLKFYNEKIGFGFIKIQNQSDPVEIFVHQSEMEDEIKMGDTVKFDIINDDRGRSATNVYLAKNSAKT